MDSTPELEITELVDLSTIKNKGKRKALAKKIDFAVYKIREF